MIAEITILIASAEKAFNLIEKGLENKKRFDSLHNEIGSIFEAKEKIDNAQNEIKLNKNEKYDDASLNQYAQEVWKAKEASKKYEKRLKKIFSDAGKSPAYYEFVAIREERKKELIQREKKEREKRIRIAKKKREFNELLFLIFVCVILMGGGGWIIAFIGSL
tara:strand:+ start:1399 stop:1887 length:489 start_codon:yes stop_codon:yes gene_type:complete